PARGRADSQPTVTGQCRQEFALGSGARERAAMPSLRFLRLLSELRGYLRVPAQSFRMALPSSLLTEWPAEAPWRRSTQKMIVGKRFYAAFRKVRNMAMQTPTRLLPALISRGLMLFSITDSATRSFSSGRVTARRPKDAWPRQRANRMAAMRISNGIPHHTPIAKLGITFLHS